MKAVLPILVAMIMAMVSELEAQNFQGVATYKSHRKLDLKMDESRMSSEQQKSIQAQLRKQFQREYTLEFNAYESIYKIVEKLEAPQPSSSGFQIRLSGGSDIMYKNVKEHRYTNQTEMMGKRFLIKDSLETRAWELTGETKTIGQYTCYKAIFKDEFKTTTFTEEGEIKEIMKPRVTTVWYTPQIPISNGPSDYFGLPGLILEVNDGQLTLICSKIVLNPDEIIEIVEPDKGKEISQEEFDTTREKKTKEMMDQFQSSGRRGSQNNRVIRIGG